MNLPHLVSEAELHTGTADAPMQLVIRLGREPVVAEIATRSRLSHSVRIAPEVRFALDLPVAGSPLTLRVKGFSFLALPELAQMREMMLNEIGEYDKHTAFAWWCEHKDTVFPLTCSKFHRIWESLWGMRCLQALPDSKRKDAFWGYLNSVDMEMCAFEFFFDEDGEPRVAAQVRCSPRDAHVGLISEELSGPILCGGDRKMGEKFAASAINFCALLHGRKFGQPGAKLDLVVKLLSAAEWWGPATSGWQRWDRTWNCTDRVNVLGKVTKAQGRLIWHMEDNATILQVRPTSLAKPAKPSDHSTVPVWMAVFLTLMFVVLLGLGFDRHRL